MQKVKALLLGVGILLGLVLVSSPASAQQSSIPAAAGGKIVCNVSYAYDRPGAGFGLVIETGTSNLYSPWNYGLGDNKCYQNWNNPNTMTSVGEPKYFYVGPGWCARYRFYSLNGVWDGRWHFASNTGNYFIGNSFQGQMVYLDGHVDGTGWCG